MTENMPQKPSAMTAAPTPDHPDILLDLTGLKFPLPVLKARRQLGQMPDGAVLGIHADDPAASLDFEHFCSTSGHKLARSDRQGDKFVFVIIKGAA